MVGRYINGDSVIDNRGTVTQNLFQYCGNNPINHGDPSGHLFVIILLGAVLVGGLFLLGGCSSSQTTTTSSSSSSSSNSTPSRGSTSSSTASSSAATSNANLTQDQKVFVATIAAEAITTGTNGRKGVANVIMNRIGQREWSDYQTAWEVCAYSGFDAYGNNNYLACMDYLNNRDGSNSGYEQLISEVIPIYNGEEVDITGGCQLYYSPATMSPPGSQPKWNYSVLEEVTVPQVDPYYEFRFFRYK